jgi:hypothetical protein
MLCFAAVVHPLRVIVLFDDGTQLILLLPDSPYNSKQTYFMQGIINSSAMVNGFYLWQCAAPVYTKLSVQLR